MADFNRELDQLLKIDFPIIMAPMFLVSNKAMMEAGMKAGIMATFPTLNYRKEGELPTLLSELNLIAKKNPLGSYGVNIIVQKSNPYVDKHLAICVEAEVPFYITSLGNPRKVAEAAHAYGAKVFCDVTNVEHAKKCYENGCDGFIAVGQGAGGHAGPNPLQILIPALKENFPDKPVIAAGGITSGAGILSLQIIGAAGVSIGTRFIASKESTVSDGYKNAIVNATMDDIVMTTKLSGSPATIINTESAKRLGYEQNWMEKLMTKNPSLKKWFKMFVQLRGMQKLERSVLPNNYLQLWCAGKSVELINEIASCEEIISRIKKEYRQKLEEICKD